MAAAEKRRGNGYLLPFICFILSITILLAGLWPLRFHPANHVHWITGQNGIRFGRGGMACSRNPVYGPGLAMQPGNSASIELAVTPAEEPTNGIANMLTLFDESGQDLMLLGQWKSHFILRSPIPGSASSKPYRETGANNVLQRKMFRHLCIVFQPDGVTIYSNGRRVQHTPRFPYPPLRSDRTARVLLGTSTTGGYPWTGDVFLLALYDRALTPGNVSRLFRFRSVDVHPLDDLPVVAALSYSFDEHAGTVARNHGDNRYDLFIPKEFRVVRKSLLTPPWKENIPLHSYLQDVTVNVLGFVPFGFFFSALLRREGHPPSFAVSIGVAALGGCVSLAIEVMQAFIPTRSSSLMDVFSNFSGTVIGILLFRRAVLIFRPATRKATRS